MPARMLLDPEIFKAYDIRGVYGEQLDGDGAEQIGRSFARVLAAQAGKRPPDLGVGLARDMRLSAPELHERYRDGLMAEGCHVLDLGMAATEVCYWLVGSRGLDGGLICTASHNPARYTGAKLVGQGALALSGESGIEEVRRTIDAGLGRAPGGGTREEVDWRDGYARAALAFVDQSAIGGLRVVLDGGNGMAGPTAGPLLERLDLDLVETYWTPDGSFPDHEPNPLLPENRELIIRRVREERADLGIAFDGDADRCFFIDEQGEFIDGDFLTALLAESLLRTHPGATILYDVRASRAVADTVAAAGGEAQRNRVGHAFFKRRMREEGSLFGGEVSGHYYFRDFYCADSGTLPALLMLELCARAGRPLSELLRPYRERYFISGEINSEVSDPAAKLREIAERYADGEQDTLDGISVDYPDWHFNVRPSNTEPLLRLCLESLVSRADMERRRDELLELIRG
ncbi:MAG TPA: phosphomannomutase/phosphoglucomutase [Solirubrobacteraceae bacterium]|nr:phosphomannomutase/phosphoglucomutase [Solirubrobacteraceae bacterium]